MNECIFFAQVLEDVARAVLFFAGYILAGLVPLAGILYLIYFLLTLPLRRRERGRLFLDLLASGLDRGASPETVVSQVAATRDLSLGARFYLVADAVARGLRLSQALAAAPRFLPPQVIAVLGVGERTGKLPALLPVCRDLLQDGVSQVRGALNYLVLLVFAATPVLLFVPLAVQTYVLPKFTEVFAEMTGSQLPAFTRWVFSEQRAFWWVELALIAFLWAVLIMYLGGPRLTGWINALAPGLVDRLAWQLPWRRQRALRDFSRMLALLLDAGVPEPEAVRLAGEAAGNQVMARDAQAVQRALNQGTRLPEAIAAMDRPGEFAWRLRNAAHGPGGFSRALAGWHEALDARAFQLEQAAAQTATTLLVLINGFIVGTLVLSIFLALIAITSEAALW